MRCLERKARQHNTTERQSNTTQLTQGSIFQRKKLPRVGLEPTCTCTSYNGNPIKRVPIRYPSNNLPSVIVYICPLCLQMNPLSVVAPPQQASQPHTLLSPQQFSNNTDTTVSETPSREQLAHASMLSRDHLKQTLIHLIQVHTYMT